MIQGIITNPALYEFAKTSQAQVGVATSLKAVGRPGFILMDKNIDSKTKKYSATKEFLYQATCFAMAMLVFSKFKKNSMKIGQKLFKDEQVFKAFNNCDQFEKYTKLDKAGKIAKLEELNKLGKETAKKAGKNFEEFKIEKINENLAKGMKEVSSVAGSIIGLSICAPLISRPLIGPVLNLLGVNKEKDNKPKEIARA